MEKRREEEPLDEKPKELIYGLEERPPLRDTLNFIYLVRLFIYFTYLRV